MHQLSRGVLAGVDRAHHEQLRLGARDGGVGQAQHHQVVARRAAGAGFFPTIADIAPGRQVGVAGCQAGCRGIGLFNCAVAGVARDAADLTRQGRQRGVELARKLGVDFDPVAGLLELDDLGRPGFDQRKTLRVVHLPGLEPACQIAQLLAVIEVDPHDAGLPNGLPAGQLSGRGRGQAA